MAQEVNASGTKKPQQSQGFFVENGSQGRARTADPVINSHLLYQLSYLGVVYKGWCP